MSDWRLTCVTCQEPVGMPFWPHGCACSEELRPEQQAILETWNALWKAAFTEEGS
jgi:hypothetical protein